MAKFTRGVGITILVLGAVSLVLGIVFVIQAMAMVGAANIVIGIALILTGLVSHRILVALAPFMAPKPPAKEETETKIKR